MSESIQIGAKTMRLIKGDLTALEVDAFVYYARHDLQLGSGFGTAISVRGGLGIQEELKQFGALETTQAVVSSAGELNASYIVHAVGPRFQEEDMERKLRATVLNTLKRAEEKDIRAIAFPPMGTGFYGVPLTICAEVMVETIAEYLNGNTKIEEVIICLLDNREYQPFRDCLAALDTRIKEAI
ncbi:MAG: macro domain-containing protein [Candidatus Zixiibacteriota bacterium]